MPARSEGARGAASAGAAAESESASAAAALPESVLVVRLGAIGDVANALVVANAIRRARPDVRVGWAVHELARPLVERHPSVDRVHVWRGRGAGGLAALVREVRRERYGLALDLQRIQKSALVARLSGAPRTLGFDRARSKELAWLWHRRRLPAGDPGDHVVRQYMDFARALGLPAEEPERALPAERGAESWAEALAAELGGPPAVVHVGASKPENRWPPERFGEVAAVLARAGERVCLTGGPTDLGAAGRARSAALSAGAPPERLRDLSGDTTLLQLVALLRRARLFVGADTGPMHLAAAVGTPVLALFGPADPRRTGPFGEGHRVVRAPGPRRRMDDLPVEAVTRELLLLGRARRGASAT